MFPARECLDRDHPSVGEVDDRLVVHQQVAGEPCRAQTLLDPHPLGDRCVHVRLVPRKLIAARGFGGVHGEVRVAQELVSSLAVPGCGDTDARRHGDRGRTYRQREFESGEHASCHGVHVIAGTRCQQNGELIATETRDRVGIADAVHDTTSNLKQHLVADAVTEGVIDLLERIEVEHHQRHGLPGGVEGRELLHQAPAQERAIGQPCERVVQSLMRERVAQSARLDRGQQRDAAREQHRGNQRGGQGQGLL